MFDLGSSPDHTPIKYRCPIKKINQITLTYIERGSSQVPDNVRGEPIFSIMVSGWVCEKSG
jgi:hypothetical protein